MSKKKLLWLTRDSKHRGGVYRIFYSTKRPFLDWGEWSSIDKCAGVLVSKNKHHWGCLIRAALIRNGVYPKVGYGQCGEIKGVGK